MPDIITLDEAKPHLNIPPTEPVDDAEITAAISAVTFIVESKVGAVISRSVTESVVFCGKAQALTVGPVLSLTSVTNVASGQVVTGFTVTPGAVLRMTDDSPLPAGRHTVVYTAGRTTVPENIKWAAKEILRHLWKTQRGGGLPLQGSEDEGFAATGAGFLIPYRAQAALEPHEQSWGFA